MQLKSLSDLLPQLWSAETSASPQRWSPANPALGQCAVTAALVQELQGGSMTNCIVTLPDGSKDSHYANRISGRKHDFTAQQFPPGSVFGSFAAKDQGLGSTRAYALSFPITLQRYDVLRTRWQEKMGSLPSRKWLLLDLDDTLIETQSLYEQARDAFARKLADDDVEQQQKVIGYAAALSRELVEPAKPGSPREGFGYSAGRFPASLLTTLLHFKPEAEEADVLDTLRRARKVFNAKAALKPGALDVVVCAKAQGYRIGIITQGDSRVQRSRLAQLPFMGNVDAVLVTPQKTTDVFTLFARAHGVDKASSWAVGDSLKSDIHPAQEAGWRTLWLNDGTNWAAHENSSHAQPTHRIARLTDTLKFTS